MLRATVSDHTFTAHAPQTKLCPTTSLPTTQLCNAQGRVLVPRRQGQCGAPVSPPWQSFRTFSQTSVALRGWGLRLSHDSPPPQTQSPAFVKSIGFADNSRALPAHEHFTSCHTNLSSKQSDVEKNDTSNCQYLHAGGNMRKKNRLGLREPLHCHM